MTMESTMNLPNLLKKARTKRDPLKKNPLNLFKKTWLKKNPRITMKRKMMTLKITLKVIRNILVIKNNEMQVMRL